jgi:peptidyl-dipeptidase Dcp
MEFLYQKKMDFVPFSKFDEGRILEEVDKTISLAKERLEKVKANSEIANFENTCRALDQIDNELSFLADIFFSLNAAETNENLQKIARDFSPKLSDFGNDISLDPLLFERIKYVYEKKETLDLDQESMRLLEDQYEGFVRGGALLNDEEKEKLRDLDSKLSKFTLEFGENVLAATNSYYLPIDNEEDLKGLSQGFINSMKEDAERLKISSPYAVTLDYPSYLPFMQNSEKRELREQVFKARSSLCFSCEQNNNKDLIKKILEYRRDKAILLGFKNHADFTLKNRMALTESTVMSFLKDLADKSFPAAKNEAKELESFARKNGFEGTFQSWDTAFWSEKLKKAKLNIDDEVLRPYFKLENVIAGAFSVANKLYGISFEEVSEADVYHEDVKTFIVKHNDGSEVGKLYADFFPRPSKRGGAWMSVFRPQYQSDDGYDHRPFITIVCNFTKPTKVAPSLLTFNEVLTLFHEFGHASHGLLTKCKYRSLSGTNVLWDFVELPSQIMENWAYEPECLNLFARHYETGEVLPENLIAKISEIRKFQEGMATIRQVSLATLDMKWHMSDAVPESVENFENQVKQEYQLLPKVEESNLSCSFSHIFQGGYSAGYYSYKWAEVLDADAFESFKENGLYDKKTADLFRENILERGNSDLPMNLYKKFKGREPNVDALLRRGGLI